MIAIGDRRGLRYLEAFGQRTEGEPMTTDTRFDLASLTKPIATASSVLLLSERGRLDLSAKASSYLSELRVPDKRNITVAQLLLHTSGLPKVNPLGDNEHGRAHMREAIAKMPLLWPPGTRFEYSDLGFILLGEIVEQVAGVGLAEFAATQLLAPLQMRDTAFRPAPSDAPRCAPTELRDDQVIRGVVDDPRAFRLDGVAGHAGLFSTAEDLARFSEMLLARGTRAGVRVLSPETVQTFLKPHALKGAVRSFGFDVESSYSHSRPFLMSPRAVGHGGYTGTSLWLDPERGVYVLLLSNRVHVGPKGSIHPLTSAIGDLALRALARADTPKSRAAPVAGEDVARKKQPDPPTPALRLGIDVLEEEAFARLRGRNVAVLSHLPARDGRGTTTLDAIARAQRVGLKVIFSPEHGLAATSEGHVKDSRMAHVRVFSLFGKARKPSAEMLAGVDSVVIDLVDVGTRFYTYMATALNVAEAAAESDLDVVLLDRPNPLDGVHVEGPVSEPEFQSFVNYHPLPLRHGLTAGELLRLLIAARGLNVRLHVVPVEGWQPARWFGETGLNWYPPSPNLRTPEQALLYPAVGLVEGTNVSVGRGTARAFEVVGAPFIRGAQLAEALREQPLVGVSVSKTAFRPTVGPYRGQALEGIALRVTSPEAYSAARTGLILARTLRALYPDAWDASRLALLVAQRELVSLLLAGADVEQLSQAARANLEGFLAQRERALIYPR